MPGNGQSWFIRERGDAIASLLLTSRAGVTVRREQETDNGADFLVEVKEAGNSIPTKFFIVHVRGTLSSDRREWEENAKRLFDPGPVYLPACAFMINVRDNSSEYAWLAEPQVHETTASLQVHNQADFQKLDEAAVDQIIDRVRAWYDVLSRHLTQPAF